MSHGVEFRRATKGDLVAFYGAPPGPTVRAWVGIIEGKIAGIGGLRYLPGGIPAEVFMDLTPLARKHPRAIVRACRFVLHELRGIPARVIADPDEPKSGRLLAKMGLTLVGTRAGLEVFSTWPH